MMLLVYRILDIGASLDGNLDGNLGATVNYERTGAFGECLDVSLFVYFPSEGLSNVCSLWVGPKTGRVFYQFLPTTYSHPTQSLAMPTTLKI